MIHHELMQLFIDRPSKSNHVHQVHHRNLVFVVCEIVETCIVFVNFDLPLKFTRFELAKETPAGVFEEFFLFFTRGRIFINFVYFLNFYLERSW